MTQLSEMLGMQRSILAELRRTREAVERIEQLLARQNDKAEDWWACGIDSHHHQTQQLALACLASRHGPVRDRIGPPRRPAPFTDPGWVCGNSMHIHSTKEEAVACMNEDKR